MADDLPQVAHVATSDARAAALGRLTGEHLQQRRLARAVRPNEARVLAIADREAHVDEHVDGAERLGDAFSVEHGAINRSCPPRYGVSGPRRVYNRADSWGRSTEGENDA